MKKLFGKILILTFCAIFGAQLCHAQSITNEELYEIISTQIKQQTQKELAELGGGEVEVKILNMPQEKIQTKGEAKIVVKSNFKGFMPRDIKRVSIYDNGTFVKSFPISVNTLVFRDVLCAINPIAREQAINSSNTAVKRVEIGQYISQTMNKMPKNQCLATRNIQKGSPVLKNYIRTKPDVIKDSMVNIVFKSEGNLKITIDGRALKEGSIGDNITVRSLKYNKIYNAEVSDKNEVTVKI